MVDVAISRANSLANLTQDISERIESMIDLKSRSIAQLISKSQMDHYYRNFTMHPYAGGPRPFKTLDEHAMEFDHS